MMRPYRIIPLCAGVLAVLFVVAAFADEKPKEPKDAKEPKAEAGVLVVVDSAGKEVKLKAWTFSQGTEHLPWLASKDAPPPADKEKAGPEVFTFREENSTQFKEGVITFVPVDRVRSIEYGMDKVTMRVVTNDKAEDDTKLVGSTEYKGVNKINVSAEVDMGAEGVAEMQYQGGAAKGSVQGFKFSAPKAPAASSGRTATVLIDDTKTPSSSVTDLKALYHFADGSERLSPLVFFRISVKYDLATIQKLEFSGKNGEDVKVTRKEGEPKDLKLLSKVTIDGKEAELVGFVGKVPAGYRLFPPHTLTSIEFDDEKKPEEKKPEEKKPEDKKPEDKKPDEDKVK